MIVKEASGIKPEIIAAISASIGILLEEEKLKAGAGNRAQALRIKRQGSAWVNAGRQKNMDNRL